MIIVQNLCKTGESLQDQYSNTSTNCFQDANANIKQLMTATMTSMNNNIQWHREILRKPQINVENDNEVNMNNDDNDNNQNANANADAGEDADEKENENQNENGHEENQAASQQDISVQSNNVNNT